MSIPTLPGKKERPRNPNPGAGNGSEKLYDVFVSYSHREGDWVERELLPHLENAGLKVAIDIRLMKGGDDLGVLRQALEASRVMVPVFSTNYFSSDFAPRELELSLQKANNIVVVPISVRAQMNIPSRFKGFQYFDFSLAFSGKASPSEIDILWSQLLDAIFQAIKKQKDPEEQARKKQQRSSVPKKKKPRESQSSKVDATGNVTISGTLDATLQPVSIASEGKVGEPTITTQSPAQPDQAEEGIEVRGKALSDIYSDKDLLGYKDYVDALVDFIESSDTKKPITIGIDAPWGGGKTTMMHMLEKRLGPPKKIRLWQRETDQGKLENSLKALWGNIKTKVSNGWRILISPRSWIPLLRKPKRPYFYTVWFNAWKYDQEESLWAALVLEILKQVRQQLGFWRKVWLSIKLNWQRFKWDDLLLDFLKSFLFVFVIALLGLGVAAGVAIASGDTIQSLSKAYAISRIKVINALGIISLVPLTYTIIKDVLGRIVSPFSLGIAKYFKKPDYESKIGFIGQFEEDFISVVSTVTQKGKWPLLIFIDDLDRCTPNKAAAVIESINLLLGSEHCVFIIGMDSHVLASSIQAKYKELQEFFRDPDNPGGLSLGHKFLEKIIQIDFRVPTPDPEHVNSFIDISLGRNPAITSAQPQVNEPQRLLQAEQRAGKSLEEAKQVVQQSNPDLTSESIEEAAEEIKARSFDDNDEVQKTVREAAPYLDYNPRKIKRYINLYRLQSLIAYRRDVLEDTVSLDVLGRWILIALRWPEFFDETLERPNLPKTFQEMAKKLQSAKTTAKRKTVLDSITGSALNQDRIKLLLDNQDIVQLLSTIPLTPDEVKNYLQLVQLSGPTQANEES